MIFYCYKFREPLNEHLADQWSTSYDDVYKLVTFGREDITPGVVVSRNFEGTIDSSALAHFAHWECISIREQRYLLCLNSEYAVFGDRSAIAEIKKMTDMQFAFKIIGMELAGLSKSTVIFNRGSYCVSETLKGAMEDVEHQMTERLKKFSDIALKLYEGIRHA